MRDSFPPSFPLVLIGAILAALFLALQGYVAHQDVLAIQRAAAAHQKRMQDAECSALNMVRNAEACEATQ